MSADVKRLRSADAEELLGMVEELTRRVDFEDGAKPKPKPHEELRAKVEAFVNANPTLKLTALVVAESIGEDNTRVGTALDSLARSGQVASVKRDGRVRLYFAKPAGSSS